MALDRSKGRGLRQDCELAPPFQRKGEPQGGAALYDDADAGDLLRPLRGGQVVGGADGAAPPIYICIAPDANPRSHGWPQLYHTRHILLAPRERQLGRLVGQG